MNRTPSFFKGHKRKILFSVMTGLGFMFAEKGLLALSIAPFLQGYQLLVLTGLVVPFLLHTCFTLLFVYGAYYFPVLRKHYFWSMLFLGLLHSAFNYSVIILTGVAS